MGLRMESMETWNRLTRVTRFYQTTRTTWIQQEQKYFYSRKVAHTFFYFKGTCMCEGKTILKREKWERNREKLVIFVAEN